MTQKPVTAAAELLRDARDGVDDAETERQLEDALALLRATHDIRADPPAAGVESTAPGG